MTSPDFEAMFQADPDPWGYRTRWYEKRKRDLTLAALTHARYGRVFEPGCGNGELSAALATRCDSLLAADGSTRAVALARERLAQFHQVEVQTLSVPDDWPDGRFDLVVVSEVAYYLSSDALARLCARCADSLSSDGSVIACHWRPQIPDAVRSADAVHTALGEQLGLGWVGGWLDKDFRIDVWSRDGRSVGEREGWLAGVPSDRPCGPIPDLR